MPIRYNVDHQTQVLGPGVSVKPGEAHDFADDEMVAGLWSDRDPHEPAAKHVPPTDAKESR